MSKGQEASENKHYNPIISLARSMFRFLNPKQAFLKIKESPSLIVVFIVILILAGLTFLNFYILFKVKLKVPEVFYTSQVEAFTTYMVQTQLIQYMISFILGIALVLFVFLLGRLWGGFGNWKQGLSAVSYIYIPNIVGLMVLTMLFMSFPIVQTNVATVVGYSTMRNVGSTMVVNTKNYTGVDSNLTMLAYVEYMIPLNATKSGNNTIMGETMLKGFLNFTYATYTQLDVKKINRSYNLTELGLILKHDTPVILNGKEFIDENCTTNCTRLIMDIVLLLNNTYTSPVEENMSIPYIMTLRVQEPGSNVKNYTIESSFYADVIQFPDYRPLFDIISGSNLFMGILIIVVNICHFFLFANAVKIIHELEWTKTIIFTLVYVAIRVVLLGFGI